MWGVYLTLIALVLIGLHKYSKTYCYEGVIEKVEKLGPTYYVYFKSEGNIYTCECKYCDMSLYEKGKPCILVVEHVFFGYFDFDTGTTWTVIHGKVGEGFD